MQQFLLLLKGKEEIDYAEEHLQERLSEYHKWVETIKAHYVTDSRLDRAGIHIPDKDNLLTDGPFLDAKEIIAGFVVIKAEGLAQAAEIANSSPLIKYFEIFVRPIVASQR